MGRASVGEHGQGPSPGPPSDKNRQQPDETHEQTDGILLHMGDKRLREAARQQSEKSETPGTSPSCLTRATRCNPPRAPSTTVQADQAAPALAPRVSVEPPQRAGLTGTEPAGGCAAQTAGGAPQHQQRAGSCSGPACPVCTGTAPRVGPTQPFLNPPLSRISVLPAMRNHTGWHRDLCVTFLILKKHKIP